MSELTDARIRAVDALWRELVRIDDLSSPARYLADLFTVEELNRVLQEGHESLSETFETCRDLFFSNTRQPETLLLGADVRATRPLVSDRLWYLFFVTRAIHMRLGYLAAKSLEQKRYVDWKGDSGMSQLLLRVLPIHWGLQRKVYGLVWHGELSTSLHAAVLA